MNQKSKTPPEYARYHAMKNDWLAKNPNATQAQIDAAMREIARKCGV